MRTKALLILIFAGLAFGCGAQSIATGPDIPMPTPNYGELPDATESIEPSAAPSAMPTAAVAPTTTRFIRSIGAGLLRDPASLTACSNYVLVCDRNHQDPIGTWSVAIRFGRDGNRQGEGYGWLSDRGDGIVRYPDRLGSASAVSTDGTIVYVADQRGVYGFYGDTQRALNSGKAYLPWEGKDLVQTSARLYLLGENFSAYSVPSFKPLFKQTVTGNGLGIDKDGKVWLAQTTSLTCYDEDGNATRTISELEDIRDVAVDPLNNDLYALTSHEVLRFDAEGTVVGRFGAFQQATSLSIDSDGYLYVCDRGKRLVEEFGPAELPS